MKDPVEMVAGERAQLQERSPGGGRRQAQDAESDTAGWLGG